MSAWTDLVRAAMALLGNLLLIGSSIAATTAIALRLALAAAPRIRYLLAVAAFLGACIVPVGLTVYASRSTSSPFSTGVPSPVLHPMTGVPAGLPPERPTLSVQGVSEGVLGGVLIVWAIVSIILVAREVTGHAGIRRRRRRWAPATPELRARLRCPDDVRLFLDDVDGPSTSGLLRPDIVLPLPIVDDLGDRLARHVLRHEVDHVRWRDPLVNALVRVGCAALWPSAPLWILQYMIQLEREASADRAAVLASSRRSDPETVASYASSLVSTARWSHRRSSQAVYGQVALLNAAGPLERRIDRLFSASSRLTRKRAVLAVAVIAAGIGTLPGLPVLSASSGPEPGLFSMLHGRDYRVEGAVKSALEELERSGETDGVIHALKSPDAETREKAAWILGEVRERRAVQPLIAAWIQDRSESRPTMAWALGMIGDRRAVPPLIASLSEPDVEGRRMSAWALGSLGDSRALDPLFRLLGDRDSSVRVAAVHALGALGDRRAIAALSRALHDDDRLVREFAARSLKELGG